MMMILICVGNVRRLLMDKVCDTCQRDLDTLKYPILDNFEGWGGKVIGYDCEDCAEIKFDMYNEWLVAG